MNIVANVTELVGNTPLIDRFQKEFQFQQKFFLEDQILGISACLLAQELLHPEMGRHMNLFNISCNLDKTSGRFVDAQSLERQAGVLPDQVSI